MDPDKWNKISNELQADGKNSDELGLGLLLSLACRKPTTWVWWCLQKSQHSVGGQEESGIQGQPELYKIYLRTKQRTVLQWNQEVGFVWRFVSVEVRQAICRGRRLWDRQKGCSRRNQTWWADPGTCLPVSCTL